MSDIHPTAVVEPGAEIGEGTRIGPYCVVGPEVRIGAGCVLHSHVVVTGITELGDGCRVFPFASLGHEPQDLKFSGERTRLVIGARNTIREHVTMNPGTVGGGGETVVGSSGLFMMSAHIAHDCRIGDRAIIANNAAIAGHVVMGDDVVVGGNAGIHQFCRIGRGAMIGGLAGVVADVIPYGTVMGDRAKLAGLNLVGLKRRGVSREEIHGLRGSFDRLFGGEGSLAERARAMEAEANPLVAEVIRFVLEVSDRSFTLPR